VVFAGYASIASVVRSYPFSTFDMYAHPETTASHIVARDTAGQVVEVTRFCGWVCDEDLEIATAPARCGPAGTFSFTPYKDQDLLRWVHGSTATTAPLETVELVRRIWRLSDESGPPPSSDCALTRCRARRVQP